MNWWELLMPQAGLIVAASIAIWGYGRQKNAELEKSLVEVRRSTYRSYLAHLPKLSAASTESRLTYNSLVAELTVIATDEVMFAIGEFTQYMNGVEPTKRQVDVYKTLIAKIVLRMRKDCFSQSQLDLKTTTALLPIQ